MRKHQPSLAITFALLAGFFYASLGLAIKLSLKHQTVPLIVFFRQLFSLGLMCFLLPFAPKESRSLKSKVFPLHLLRAFASTSGMVCFYIAIKYIPLSDAITLSYTRPLFIPFVTYLWSGKIGKKNVWLGLFMGFLGVILILKPEGDMFNLGSIVGLASGVSGALAFTSIRKLTKTEPANRIILYYLSISLFLMIVPVLFMWQTPSPEDWIALAIIALLATAYQSCLTRAYQYAPAAIVGSLLYSAIVYSFIFEFIIQGASSLSIIEIVGASLIAAGSYLSLKSQREVK